MDSPKKEFDARKSLNALWKTSQKLHGSDAVSKYLHSRKIVIIPDALRCHPQCYESETRKKFPAMLAMFKNIEGKPISIHRTYLDGTGKAKIKSPKKLMKGTEKLRGGSIRLFPDNNGTIGIAEGIETALSATQITDIPCWAAVSSTLLQSFNPPENIRRIVVFGDNDANFCGQQAAYFLANRLYNADRIVEVEFPPDGKDWNDYLMAKGG